MTPAARRALRPGAVVVSAAVALLTVGMWLVLPLWVRVRHDRWDGDGPG